MSSSIRYKIPIIKSVKMGEHKEMSARLYKRLDV